MCLSATMGTVVALNVPELAVNGERGTMKACRYGVDLEAGSLEPYGSSGAYTCFAAGRLLENAEKIVACYVGVG